MKTILKRILAMISLTLVVALSGLATIVLFPQPLFAYTVEHGKITVYANEEINPAIIPRIDNAMKLVNESELHDPDYTYDLFLSYTHYSTGSTTKYSDSAPRHEPPLITL